MATTTKASKTDQKEGTEIKWRWWWHNRYPSEMTSLGHLSQMRRADANLVYGKGYGARIKLAALLEPVARAVCAGRSWRSVEHVLSVIADAAAPFVKKQCSFHDSRSALICRCPRTEAWPTQALV